MWQVFEHAAISDDSRSHGHGAHRREHAAVVLCGHSRGRADPSDDRRANDGGHDRTGRSRYRSAKRHVRRMRPARRLSLPATGTARQRQWLLRVEVCAWRFSGNRLMRRRWFNAEHAQKFGDAAPGLRLPKCRMSLARSGSRLTGNREWVGTFVRFGAVLGDRTGPPHRILTADRTTGVAEPPCLRTGTGVLRADGRRLRLLSGAFLSCLDACG